MTHDEALVCEVMPLVAVTELKRHGIPAVFISWEHCVWVEDSWCRHGVEESAWVKWPLNSRGRIHGAKILRFLGY